MQVLLVLTHYSRKVFLSMSEYNVDVVRKVLSEFKSMRELNPDEPIEIVFDADNTLYRFSDYGMIAEAKRDMYTKGYFKNLNIFTEAPIVIENLQKLGIRVHISTGLIDSPFCKREKEESFAYYFPMIHEEDIHFVQEGQSKAEMFTSVKNKILVDDWYYHINDWYQHGGVGIKKSYTGKTRPVPVITSLIDLFRVLHFLKAY